MEKPRTDRIFRIPEHSGPSGPALLSDRNKKIVFLSGTRTPFVRAGGALKDFSPIDLGAAAARAAIEQAGLADRAEVIDAAFFGNGMHASIDSHYGARHVALKAGCSPFSTALTINRICWSGGEAVAMGAKELLSGEAEVVLVGGYESTSQSPMLIYAAAYGFPYMEGPRSMFLFKDGLNDPYINTDMMGTAENLCRLYGISRADIDEFAVVSQQRAKAAQDSCRFSKEITPVKVGSGRKETLVMKDDNLRPETTLQGLARLQAVKPGGVHTGGNSSGIVDGAGALVMTTYGKAKELGVEPIGELLSWAVAGVDPHYMGIGPVPAMAMALKRAGLTMKDIAHIEVNEAFGGQYLAVEREAGLDRAKTNIHGGAIALGHPLGATGARLTISLLREGGIGMASACIGGGQGGALIVEGFAS